jgi:hypothetical protein
VRLCSVLDALLDSGSDDGGRRLDPTKQLLLRNTIADVCEAESQPAALSGLVNSHAAVLQHGLHMGVLRRVLELREDGCLELDHLLRAPQIENRRVGEGRGSAQLAPLQSS